MSKEMDQLIKSLVPSVGSVPEKLSLWRSILAFLPGFCKYCGKRYQKGFNVVNKGFSYLDYSGVKCPDGHEGILYIEAFCDTVRERFDLVAGG